MFQIPRILDTLFGYTSWHDTTSEWLNQEKALGSLYEEEDDEPMQND